MTHEARVYGGSLYDLAKEENLTEVMLEQMKDIKAIFRENPDYFTLLSEPSISKKDRVGLIDEAFGAQAEKYLVNFLKLLCERGLIREFPGCTDEFIARFNKDNNICEAVITSAVALTDSQRGALKDKLEKMSGKTVEIIEKVDPEMIAGIKVELEGKSLDGTVNARVDRISRKLSELVV